MAFSLISESAHSSASKTFRIMKSRSSTFWKLVRVYGIACRRAFTASLQGPYSAAAESMLFVRPIMIWFFNSYDNIEGSNSSQMYPSVWREASLIWSSWLLAFVHRLAISSCHSPRGISICAIDAIRLATYDLTSCDGEARVCMIAYLTFILNAPSS